MQDHKRSNLDRHQGSKAKVARPAQDNLGGHGEAQACHVNFENDQKSIAPLRAPSQAVSTFETSSTISKRVLLEYDPKSSYKEDKCESGMLACGAPSAGKRHCSTVLTGPAARFTQLLGYLT